MIRLEQVATIRAGYPFRSRLEHSPKGNALVLQMKDVTPSTYADNSGAVRTTVKAPEAHRLAPGDLLLKARGNTFCAIVGSIPVLPLVAAAPLFVVRPDRARISPEFLRWIINHDSTQAQLTAAAVGTYVPTVSKSSIELLEFELPSISRQQLIVEIARLAARENELLKEIAIKRKDAVDKILLRFSKSPGSGERR